MPLSLVRFVMYDLVFSVKIEDTAFKRVACFYGVPLLNVHVGIVYEHFKSGTVQFLETTEILAIFFLGMFRNILVFFKRICQIDQILLKGVPFTPST